MTGSALGQSSPRLGSSFLHGAAMVRLVQQLRLLQLPPRSLVATCIQDAARDGVQLLFVDGDLVAAVGPDVHTEEAARAETGNLRHHLLFVLY